MDSKRIQKFQNVAKRRAEIFVLLGVSGGMLPRKSLKKKCLRLAEIGFPTTYFGVLFLIQSQIGLATGDLFETYHSFYTKFSLPEAFYFDDCLKISVLGRFDRNYELTLDLCIKTLCVFSERFELRLQPDLTTVEHFPISSFQTVWSRSFKL